MTNAERELFNPEGKRYICYSCGCAFDHMRDIIKCPVCHGKRIASADKFNPQIYFNVQKEA